MKTPAPTFTTFVSFDPDSPEADCLDDLKWLARRAPRQWPISVRRARGGAKVEGALRGIAWLEHRLPSGVIAHRHGRRPDRAAL